jgi:uncharacterized protein YfaP (DUF2135 family)
MLITLPGCDKIEDIYNDLTGKKDDGVFTKKEIVQITADYKTIALTADEIILQDKIDTMQIKALLEEYKALESVEDAWLESGGFAVKFKKGGMVSWLFPQRFVAPSFFDISTLQSQVRSYSQNVETKASTNKIFPGNKKMGILCTMTPDDEWYAVQEEFDDVLYESFTNAGFDVDVKHFEQLDVTFFKKHLADYGIIYLLAHGSNWINPNSIGFMTGEATDFDGNEENLKFLSPEYQEDFKEYRIIPSSLSYYINDKMCLLGRRLMVTDMLIDDYYPNDKNTFPNTLFFIASCYGMGHDMLLGKMLERKGVGITIGYNNSNNIGPYTAWYIFNALESGYTIKETFENFIPSECMTNVYFEEQLQKQVTAKLVRYPNADNMALVDIDPDDDVDVVFNANYRYSTERVVSIKGYLTGFLESGKISATLSVNGQTSALPIKKESGIYTFEQNVVLRKGINTIRVLATETFTNGHVNISAGNETEIDGRFEDNVLYTQLAWNTNGTDVDLHLTGPDGVDCYFSRKTTSWGGTLDVDDTNGYGPEAITVPVLKKEGVYTLRVHYYASNGKGSSNASVLVETTAESRTFTHTLNQTGNTWTVCTIELPSGKINAADLRSSPADNDDDLFKNLPPKTGNQ